MNKPMQPRGSLQRALLSTSQLKPPPFKYEVSGPSLCPGHLYTVGNRSDEHRAEYFAALALSAVVGRADLPVWENEPGLVAVVVSNEQSAILADKVLLVAQAWGINLPITDRLNTCGCCSGPVERLRYDLERDTGDEPFSLIIVDQLDALTDSAPVEHFRQLTRLRGNPAVVVGHKPHRQISPPIIVSELRAKTEAHHA